MDDNGKFIEKMLELGVGMSMIQQMPSMMKDVLQPLMDNSAPTMPPTIEPSVAQVYLAIEKKQAGPFTEDEMIKLIQNNILQPETLVWKVGMPNWSPASQVADINKLFIMAKLK